MTVESMKEKIKNILQSYVCDREDGGIEIYTDCRDRELSDRTLERIFKSENPRETFEEILCEWVDNYEMEFGEDNIEEEIREHLTEDENDFFTEFYNELWDYIRENTYFYCDFSDFNMDLSINIMIDCGNWNYDCTCDNVLNWYGNSGDGSIDKESSMLWLAKTQGKATELREACKQVHRDDGYYVDRDKNKDKFIESCIQEFENLPSSMGTMTFLVKMSLFKLFDLIELQNKEYDEKGKYDPRKNEKSKSYFTLDKNTMCGLYNPWDGSGSVLEIELDKDVNVPIKYANFAIDGLRMYGNYDVDEVYGLVGNAWKDTLKEIKVVK